MSDTCACKICDWMRGLTDVQFRHVLESLIMVMPERFPGSVQRIEPGDTPADIERKSAASCAAMVPKSEMN